MAISWFGILLLLVVAFFIVKGLSNPRSRPFVFGLLFVGLLAFFFVGMFSVRAVRIPDALPSVAVVNEAPWPPAYSSLQMTDAAKPQPSTPPVNESEDAASPQPPDWVKAEPKPHGNLYLMTRQTDPYTTLLECERDVPKAEQSALTEYAQLLLGNDQARYVHLSEGELRRLERERWAETRVIEIGGEARDMHIVHLLVGFDQAMQQNIRMMAENALVSERLKGAGFVLGSVLGFLALLWGGLSLLGPRQCTTSEANVAAPPAAAVARTGAGVYALALVGLLTAFVAIAAVAYCFIS
jgi:hypothetical protein